MTNPKIGIIAALSNNFCIGKHNQLPWSLPDDLKSFKQITLGKPVLMGRNTWESIGRPLPGRQNLVLTRNPNWQSNRAVPVHDWQQALELIANNPPQGHQAEELTTAISVHDIQLWVIGGGNVYENFIDQSCLMYLTRVNVHLNGDTFFPNFDTYTWRRIHQEKHSHDERHAYDFCFETWVKNN